MYICLKKNTFVLHRLINSYYLADVHQIKNEYPDQCVKYLDPTLQYFVNPVTQQHSSGKFTFNQSIKSQNYGQLSGTEVYY